MPRIGRRPRPQDRASHCCAPQNPTAQRVGFLPRCRPPLLCACPPPPCTQPASLPQRGRRHSARRRGPGVGRRRPPQAAPALWLLRARAAPLACPCTCTCVHAGDGRAHPSGAAPQHAFCIGGRGTAVAPCSRPACQAQRRAQRRASLCPSCSCECVCVYICVCSTHTGLLRRRGLGVGEPPPLAQCHWQWLAWARPPPCRLAPPRGSCLRETTNRESCRPCPKQTRTHTHTGCQHAHSTPPTRARAGHRQATDPHLPPSVPASLRKNARDCPHPRRPVRQPGAQGQPGGAALGCGSLGRPPGKRRWALTRASKHPQTVLLLAAGPRA